MSRLRMMTWCPACAIFCAANIPAGPAPTTNTVFKCALLFSPIVETCRKPMGEIGLVRRRSETVGRSPSRRVVGISRLSCSFPVNFLNSSDNSLQLSHSEDLTAIPRPFLFFPDRFLSKLRKSQILGHICGFQEDDAIFPCIFSLFSGKQAD